MDNDEQQIVSPVPEKVEAEVVTKGLSFYKALPAVTQGKSIKSEAWGGDYCGKLLDERLKIYTPNDKKYHDWIVSKADLEAEDWIII